MKSRLLIIIGIIGVLVFGLTYYTGSAHADEHPNSFFRIPDDSFVRQSLQTGETFGDGNNTLGWFGLIMSLFIVSTFVIMKIKKRRK